MKVEEHLKEEDLNAEAIQNLALDKELAHTEIVQEVPVEQAEEVIEVKDLQAVMLDVHQEMVHNQDAEVHSEKDQAEEQEEIPECLQEEQRDQQDNIILLIWKSPTQ